ncbi:MAG: HAD family phosphatase [Parachlamydiales bacterium]
MEEYQLFMFDFDGLLVDTERGHYEAYRRMCRNRGIDLPWDFTKYCSFAHYSHDGLQHALYKEFPELLEQEPTWLVLYKEKTKAIIELYHEGAITLMPGVEKFLTLLADKDYKRCVVTHSASELVQVLRKQHPILNTIPYWITREHYSKAKPDPECYITAQRQLMDPDGKAVGFEDTVRGLRAVMGSGAQGVLVTSMEYPEIPHVVEQGALHFASMDEVKAQCF